MKAISLHQPWASLCVTRQPQACKNTDNRWILAVIAATEKRLGNPMVKRFETRSWLCPPNLIGSRIALHATVKRPDKHGTIGDWRYDLYDDAWYVRPVGSDSEGFAHGCHLPLGAVVGSAVIEACYPIIERNEMGRHEPPFITINTPIGALSQWHAENDPYPWTRIDDQLPYGDYRPGRYAWLLADAAPTTERCPWCWGDAYGACLDPKCVETYCVPCHVCAGAGRCEPIPARGRQRIWNWQP